MPSTSDAETLARRAEWNSDTDTRFLPHATSRAPRARHTVWSLKGSLPKPAYRRNRGRPTSQRLEGRQPPGAQRQLDPLGVRLIRTAYQVGRIGPRDAT